MIDMLEAHAYAWSSMEFTDGLRGVPAVDEQGSPEAEFSVNPESVN